MVAVKAISVTTSARVPVVAVVEARSNDALVAAFCAISVTVPSVSSRRLNIHLRMITVNNSEINKLLYLSLLALASITA